MAVTAGKQLGIFGIAGCQSVIVNLLVLCLTVGHNLVVTIAQLLKGCKDGLAIARPVTFIVNVHIAYILHLVVTYHHIGVGLAYLTKIVGKGQEWHLALFHTGNSFGRCLGQLACCSKGGCHL